MPAENMSIALCVWPDLLGHIRMSFSSVWSRRSLSSHFLSTQQSADGKGCCSHKRNSIPGSFRCDRLLALVGLVGLHAHGCSESH